MKLKRIFAAVLAAAMLLSFAGCANKDTQGDSSEPAGEAKLLLKLADALAKEFLGWKDIGHLDAVVGSYSERCGDTFEGEFYFFLIELGTNE